MTVVQICMYQKSKKKQTNKQTKTKQKTALETFKGAVGAQSEITVFFA